MVTSMYISTRTDNIEKKYEMNRACIVINRRQREKSVAADFRIMGDRMNSMRSRLDRCNGKRPSKAKVDKKRSSVSMVVKRIFGNKNRRRAEI